MATSFIEIPSLNWDFFQESLLLNPRTPSSDLSYFQKLYEKRPPLADHLWLSSSGTSSKPKLIALSRTALLNSAQAVNHFIEASSKDKWLLCLPCFHVGGLGVLARAHLSNSSIETLYKWDAAQFIKVCEKEKITLSSLVPLQLEELVALNQKAPSNLRFIFIGGGALSPQLKQKALDLNFPVYETYGMTECCSQIASEGPLRRGLEVLKIWHPDLNQEGRLRISGSALATAIVSEAGIFYPAQEKYFQTEDFVELHSMAPELQILKSLGRGQDFQKIKGENVSLNRLQSIVEEIKPLFSEITDAALYFEKLDGDEFLSLVLKIVSPQKDPQVLNEFSRKFAEKTLVFERPSQVLFVNEIKRSPLGKIIRV